MISEKSCNEESEGLPHPERVPSDDALLYAPVAVDVVAQFFENKENRRKISIGLVGKRTQMPSPSPDPFSC